MTFTLILKLFQQSFTIHNDLLLIVCRVASCQAALVLLNYLPLFQVLINNIERLLKIEALCKQNSHILC